MTGLAKSINSTPLHNLWRVLEPGLQSSGQEHLPRAAKPDYDPSWEPQRGPERQQGNGYTVFFMFHGESVGKQQHLVLVPEESSDHVAWRILGWRGPDARS